MGEGTIGLGVTGLGEFGALLCPLPKCGEELYLRHEAYVPIAYDTRVEHMQPEHAITTTWRVECAAGHVLLLPAEPHDESADFVEQCEMCEEMELPHNDLDRLRAVLLPLHMAATQSLLDGAS